MLLAVAAVFVGACVQSASGFGFALVAAPALLAVTTPGQAVLALLLLGPVLNLLLLFGERRSRHVRGGDVRALVAAAVPGLVLGALVVSAAPKEGLQVLAGVVVLAGVATEAWPTALRTAAGRLSGYGVGLLSGAFTTATAVNGPPIVLWLRARGATPAELRDTMGATLLALSVLGLPALALLGALAPPSARSAAALLGLLAATVAGHRVGRAAFARLDRRRFDRVVLLVVTVAGAASVVAGLR